MDIGAPLGGAEDDLSHGVRHNEGEQRTDDDYLCKDKHDGGEEYREGRDDPEGVGDKWRCGKDAGGGDNCGVYHLAYQEVAAVECQAEGLADKDNCHNGDKREVEAQFKEHLRL